MKVQNINNADLSFKARVCERDLNMAREAVKYYPKQSAHLEQKINEIEKMGDSSTIIHVSRKHDFQDPNRNSSNVSLSVSNKKIVNGDKSYSHNGAKYYFPFEIYDNGRQSGLVNYNVIKMIDEDIVNGMEGALFARENTLDCHYSGLDCCVDNLSNSRKALANLKPVAATSTYKACSAWLESIETKIANNVDKETIKSAFLV